MIEKRFAFDLELLVVARHLGYRRFVEAPVVIGERFSSTINLLAVRGMFIDTLAIFYRLRILRFYDRVQPQASAARPNHRHMRRPRRNADASVSRSRNTRRRLVVRRSSSEVPL